MSKISPEQFKQMYGGEVLSQLDQIDSSRFSRPTTRRAGNSGFMATMRDIPSDLKEFGENSFNVFADAKSDIYDAVSANKSGDITRGDGLLQSVGAGARVPFRAVWEGVKTAAKLPFSPGTEEKVGDFVSNVKEGIAEDTRAGAERRRNSDGSLADTQKQIDGLVQEFSTLYETDPRFRAQIRGTAGIAEGLAEALGYRFGTQAAGRTVDAATDIGRTTMRTANDAAQDIVQRTNNIQLPSAPNVSGTAQATADAATGVFQQTRDFLGRTARQAQNTAVDNRRLAEMPEPRAQLIRYGADEQQVINQIDQAAPEELPIYQRLIDQARAKQADPTPNTQHPKVIVGQEFMKPVEHIINTRKSVGAQLGEMRSNLSTARTVNTNSAFRSFHQYLKNNYNVQFDADGNIISGTGTLASGDVPEIQKMYNELRSGTFMSERQIDDWLQRSLKDYDLRQAREQTFSDEVSRIAERARQEMGALMPEEYNALRTQYAELSKPLQDVVKLLQYKGNLDDLTAKELKAAEVAFRVLGNAADRPQSVIEKVIEVAGNTGYTSEVDLNRLIYVADQMEDLYDIVPTRSFAGQTARGTNQSDAVGSIADIATLNYGGLYNRIQSSQATREEVQEAFESYITYLLEQSQ